MGYFMAFMMIVQAMQQSHTAKTTGEMNRASAALQKEEDLEATRRAKLEMAKKESTAQARIAASGIVGGQGSSKVYMDELKRTHTSEINWMNKATESRYKLGLQGANVREQAGQLGALTTLTKAAGTASDTYWGK